MKKRIAALFLALSLALSLTPAALAAEGKISRLFPEECPEAPESRDFSQYVTGKLLTKEELTLKGKPFYEYTYSEAKALLPFKRSSAPSLNKPKEGEPEEYITWSESPTACSSVRHYVGSDDLEAFHLTCCDIWTTEAFTVIDIGVRGIKTGDSLESVLQALGVSEEGAPLIAAEMMDNHTNFELMGNERHGVTEGSSYGHQSGYNHDLDRLVYLDAPRITWRGPDDIALHLDFFLGRLGDVSMCDYTKVPDNPSPEEPAEPGETGTTDPTAPAFTDVPEGEYYAKPVAWAVQNGITNGTSDTAFSPDEECTEAQILTFLWRAAGKPTEGIKTPVANVKESDYFYQAVMWANDMGMIDPGTFEPSKPCTRSTAVFFICQAFAVPYLLPVDSGFTDVPADADYAYPVAWAVENGITNGDGGETIFSPDKVCTRGQIVTFLHRAYVEAARLPVD